MFYFFSSCVTRRRPFSSFSSFYFPSSYPDDDRVVLVGGFAGLRDVVRAGPADALCDFAFYLAGVPCGLDDVRDDVPYGLADVLYDPAESLFYVLFYPGGVPVYVPVGHGDDYAANSRIVPDGLVDAGDNDGRVLPTLRVRAHNDNHAKRCNSVNEQWRSRNCPLSKNTDLGRHQNRYPDQDSNDSYNSHEREHGGVGHQPVHEFQHLLGDRPRN